MKVLSIFIVILLGIVNCKLLEQRNEGVWSDVLNPTSAEMSGLPDIYFLCGYQFKVTRWIRYYQCEYLLIYLVAGRVGIDGSTNIDAEAVPPHTILVPVPSKLNSAITLTGKTRKSWCTVLDLKRQPTHGDP